MVMPTAWSTEVKVSRVGFSFSLSIWDNFWGEILALSTTVCISPVASTTFFKANKKADLFPSARVLSNADFKYYAAYSELVSLLSKSAW